MGTNYGRRKDDNGFKIDMFPKWLNVAMIILKGVIVLIPFIISIKIIDNSCNDTITKSLKALPISVNSLLPSGNFLIKKSSN